jgi:hypothetical protein
MNRVQVIPEGPLGRSRLHRSLLVIALTVLAAVAAALLSPDRAASAGPEAPADTVAAARDTTGSQHPVVAYYFHTTQRCASCKKLEAYAEEAIATGFPAELKSGRLLWRVVNFEEKGNEHFVKDYQLYTKSLVLVGDGGEKPAAWKNLEKIWQHLNDKTRFIRYVQDETRAFLKAEDR